jgi:membrane associated rhomboid family serine protease
MGTVHTREPAPARRRAAVLVFLLALLWALEAADQWLLDGALQVHGVQPRRADGLWGIPFAPFLHRDFEHLAANTLPLVVLGWLVLLSGIGQFIEVVLFATLIGGLGIWVLGAEGSVHLGASILIFGFFGYLILRGLFEQSFGAIAVAVLVGCLYGGLVWGILPSEPGVSWEGHLSGFAGGGASSLARARSGGRRSSA